jgi:TctA family transporter
MDYANSLVLGFSYLFSGNAFVLMLVGIGVGFAVGILPGIGGTTSLALMIPFVINMQPAEAFAFLLGMVAVTATTGDITSILFGIPGEPTTASTIVDGHPLAKRGEAGRALGAALTSSLIGAILGSMFLAMAIPIARPIVLSFGSPEFLMSSVLGITLVSSVSGNALVKGLISTGIGIVLSTVGLSSITGVQRYTFGQLFLWDGLGLTPIVVGLFAIPEIVALAVQGTSIARKQAGKLGGVMEGVKDAFRHWWLVVRCSAIGTFAGIIPGIGTASTQWLAYGYAVQVSPNKERFGRGAIEGVLGPGAANNSTLGGGLTTTVAFGIPASAMMAILMGAFMVHGIVPGPDMLIPEPKGNLALTFSFAWTMIVSNIITVAICLLFLDQLAKITQVKGSLLLPMLLILIYLGGFAEKNAFEDVGILLAFGALGWIMEQLSWPRPPLVLGLVLGALMENRFFLSVDNYGLSWLLRPGVIILFVLTIAAVFYPLLRAKLRQPVEGPS